MKNLNFINLWRSAMMLIIALFCSTVSWADDVVTIGEPKNTYGHMLPIGALNKYALTQQVYTTSEFSHDAGKIWSIGFNTVNGDISRHLSIYITHTTEDGVWSYTPVTENDLYFSGDVYFKAGQWNTIDFTKPFEYDGTSNLLITIYDDTGTRADYSTLTNKFYNPGSTQLIYATSDDVTYNPLDANESTSFTSISSWKAQIQLIFSDNPTPSNLTVTDITDVSAQAQCTLRGDATAWNLRYRKVAGEGEEEMRWVQENNLTTSSFALEGLTAATKYEAQAQSVFGEDIFSEWTATKTFTTNCCPPEEMCEILYSMNVYNSSSAAFQIVDAETGIEVAYVQFAQQGVSGGAISLCAGRKYNVNWVGNNAASYQTEYCTFTLFYLPGDEFYTMHFGGAPEEDGLLTQFVMDCTQYCTPMPRFLTADDITWQSATLSYQATTLKEEIQYSTDPTFPEDNTSSVIVTRDDTEKQTIYKLENLESLTLYYIRVRSVCEEDGGEVIDDSGKSRWTKPIRVITDTKFGQPSRVTTEPVNPTSEDLSWKRHGMETVNNVNYRPHGEGTPVEAGQILLVDLDGDGESFENWGGTNYASYGNGNNDNVIGVYNVPANSMVSWKAMNAKTGDNTAVRYQVGFVKQTKKYNDDADGKAAAQEALKATMESKIEEQTPEEDPEEAPLQKILSEAKEKENLLLEKTAQLKDMPEDDPDRENVERQCALLNAELGALRSQIDVLENEQAEAAAALAAATGTDNDTKVRTKRAPEDEGVFYFFYIRHFTNDMLLVSDITVIPPENIGNWIVIPDVEDVNYILKNLQPGTVYETMVEPVYDGGFIGIPSPISIFSTIGEEATPIEAEFSVSKEKTVRFSNGNLRYDGRTEKWSLAPQQYAMLGLDNIEAYTYSSYPADLRDLLCWSTDQNYYGSSFYYSYTDDEAAPLFCIPFADYGVNPDLISDLGSGWQTLTKDEWEYLLNGRENAASLRAFATVNLVKGLILLPDGWTAPDGAPSLSDSPELTADQWSLLETAGAVFLPAAGQMTAVYADYTATTTLMKSGEEGFYWTGTPSDEVSETVAWDGYVINFTDSQVQPVANNRRVASSVRLVKTAYDKKLVSTFNDYKDDKIEECDNMAMEGDAQSCQDLIDKAKSDIRDLAYDYELTLQQNLAAIDRIVNKLARDLANERESTGIINIYDLSISNSRFDNVWYTIDGRRLNAKPTQRGVYIHNGKKIVVK